MLPVTSLSLYDATSHPYFLWWVDTTVGEFRRHLESPSVETRAYWLGALLREANIRDVWLFTSEREIRELWPHLVRHLGGPERAGRSCSVCLPNGRHRRLMPASSFSRHVLPESVLRFIQGLPGPRAVSPRRRRRLERRLSRASPLA